MPKRRAKLRNPLLPTDKVSGRAYATGKPDDKLKHYGFDLLPAIPPGKNSIQVTVYLSTGETAYRPDSPYCFEGPGKVVYIVYSPSEVTATFEEQKK